MKQRIQRGFTLIEVMVTVAIVGILLAVAVPAYSDYVVRGRLSEAFTALGGAQPAAEQYWSNNRTYVGFAASNTFPANTPYFTYALSGESASTYTLTATGTGKMAGFTYTIDQNGTHATTASPAGWGVNAACWVDHKGGACTN
ncbi:prepilin-type N-terminal cleavage/methylation domain-containing protein [Oxalobacteraceae bacterium OTU3REALA1]|nr:prepilin-type N-terminal cleavage/methylation domain-containing protein [Oxalobacteraceae bacterium OTU3REALA1]